MSPYWQRFTDGIRMSICASHFTHLQNYIQLHSSQKGLLLASRREHRSIIFREYQTDQIKCSILLVCNMEQQVSEFVLKQRRPPPPAPILIRQESSCRLAQDGERFQLFLKLCCLIVAAMIYQSFASAEQDIYF